MGTQADRDFDTNQRRSDEAAMGVARRKISIEHCSCGHGSCKDYWLVGIGKFVQGSGFTEEEAQRIADLLNDAAEA